MTFKESTEQVHPQLGLERVGESLPDAETHTTSFSPSARRKDLFLLDGPSSRDKDLVDANGSIHVDRLFEELGLKPAEIALALGVRAPQVHAWCRGGAMRPRTRGAESLLMDFVRVATYLRALLPIDPERRKSWVRQPLLRVRGKTPFELVCSGQGQTVVDILWEAYSGDVSM